VSESPATEHQEARIERALGVILRLGVGLAGLVVLAGALVLLREPGRGAADYRAFHGEPSELRGVAGVWRAAWSLRGRGLIQLGLLILIATPIARVAVSVVVFARRRDWLYAAFASTVLAGLLFGLLGARR
jgi:uncharacterized membrane protein